jgi:SulP family sulfate permease
LTTPLASPVRDRLAGWAQAELAPRPLLASLNAALILYLLEVILALSHSALIFSGALSEHLPHVLGAVLLGSAVLVATVTALSAYPGSIASVQSAPTVVLALATAAAAAAVAGRAGGPEQVFATATVLIFVTAAATGAAFLALGVFKLGGLVRFLPYPVLGGFLAGTGWLLLVGGVNVTARVPAGPALLAAGPLARWLPAGALGVAALLAARRWKSPLALPAVFAAALAGFYAVMLARGQTPAALAADGWLLGPFPPDVAWRFGLRPETLARVDWPALLGALPLAAPAVVVSVTALLLNASGLELAVRRDIGLNRELLASGAANLASGLAGGLMGFTAISLSSLEHTLTRGRRLTGFLAAALLLLTVAAGTAALSYVPRLLLGGLLTYMGLALLHEWVVQAWRALPRVDYAIVQSVLVVIATSNFLWGVGLGLALTVILFVISYSRVSIVRYELTAGNYRSRVSRSLGDSEILQQRGEQLLIFKLQNFIFFGTAHSLFEHARRRSLGAGGAGQPVRFLLLDFEQVTGLDSTALLSFRKMLAFTRENGIELILTGLANRAREQMLKGGFTDEAPGVCVWADIDHGVEWAEEQILAAEAGERAGPGGLRAQLEAIVPGGEGVEALLRHLERREVGAGEYLIRAGDEADCLYYLEAGQLTVQLEKAGREPVRLETMRGGRIVGELGFFLGTRRNASVVADRPSVVYALGRAVWERMVADEPDAAQALTRIAIHLLGERVAHMTRAVDALQQ